MGRPLLRPDVACPAAIACSLAALVVLTFANPWVFTADDSLFYLVVGRSIVAEGWVTFNGLIPTNGVQPLWQAMVAGIIGAAELFGVDSEVGQLRAVLVLNWVLALTALVQMWALLRRLGTAPPFRLAGVVVLGACLCGPWGMFASEGHLVAVTLLWLLAAVERWSREGPRPATVAQVGIAAGLMMLSRLDTVWVALSAVSVLAALCVGAARDRGPREPDASPSARLRAVANGALPVLAAGAVASTIVAPYLVWNVVRFGHLTPISGAIKVDLGDPTPSIDGIGMFGVAILASIWVGGVLGVLRPPRHRARLAVWLVPAVGATVSSAFYLAFSRGPFTQWFWYFVPHAVALATTVALAGARLALDRPAWSGLLRASALAGAGALAVASALFCGIRYVGGPPDRLWSQAQAFATELDETLEPGTPVATVDMPGVLGYASGRPVVALDGLVGDFDFQDRWRDEGGACVLASLGVSHLVTVDDIAVTERRDDAVVLGFSSWLHREPPSELRGEELLIDFPNRRYQLWQLEDTCTEG